MSRITQQELESYLWGAAVLLRGLIDAGDYKQFIFPLLFFKRVSDVWDEECEAALSDSGGDLTYAEFAENHRFQIPDGAHWKDLRQTFRRMSALQSRRPCGRLNLPTPTCWMASSEMHHGRTASAYPMRR